MTFWAATGDENEEAVFTASFHTAWTTCAMETQGLNTQVEKTWFSARHPRRGRSGKAWIKKEMVCFP